MSEWINDRSLHLEQLHDCRSHVKPEQTRPSLLIWHIGREEPEDLDPELGSLFCQRIWHVVLSVFFSFMLDTSGWMKR